MAYLLPLIIDLKLVIIDFRISADFQPYLSVIYYSKRFCQAAQLLKSNIHIVIYMSITWIIREYSSLQARQIHAQNWETCHRRGHMTFCESSIYFHRKSCVLIWNGHVFVLQWSHAESEPPLKIVTQIFFLTILIKLDLWTWTPPCSDDIHIYVSIGTTKYNLVLKKKIWVFPYYKVYVGVYQTVD